MSIDVCLEVEWRDDTGIEQVGYVVETVYEPVSGKWKILVVGNTGKFYALDSDDLELRVKWVNNE